VQTQTVVQLALVRQRNDVNADREMFECGPGTTVYSAIGDSTQFSLSAVLLCLFSSLSFCVFLLCVVFGECSLQLCAVLGTEFGPMTFLALRRTKKEAAKNSHLTDTHEDTAQKNGAERII
jgi:hypothetical protein